MDLSLPLLLSSVYSDSHADRYQGWSTTLIKLRLAVHIASELKAEQEKERAPTNTQSMSEFNISKGRRLFALTYGRILTSMSSLFVMLHLLSNGLTIMYFAWGKT